ncbi:GFA family protein [Fangia hongkongensis]|uniref:GFA family protein n=1 Tax=Fangia hongkongensis TaxID=270495 RepID=UPI00037EE4CD|nr:GFA family protein [Fangia hongkongensis]MBK2124549.1 GFA family protein [Fangia hongkongensis]
MDITGGCICGKVKYTLKEMPVMMGNCHCLDCQKWTGCAYKPVCMFSNKTLKLEGEIRYYTKAADSGEMIHRGFCASCGGDVVTKCDQFVEYVMIGAGTLDQPSVYNPNIDFYTDSAQKWDCFLDHTHKFSRQIER